MPSVDHIPSLPALFARLDLDLDGTLVTSGKIGDAGKIKGRRKEDLNTSDSSALRDVIQYTRRQSLSKSKRRASMHPTIGASGKRRIEIGEKCNSCSSLFITGTVGKENMERVLRSLSLVICHQIHQAQLSGIHIPENDLPPIITPSASALPGFRTFGRVPRESEITDFFEYVWHSVQLPPELLVITLIYLDRLLALNPFLSLTPRAWFRLLFGTMVLAIKVWDDQAVWNIDFCGIFQGLRVSELNELERWICRHMAYDISVPPSLYARYHFDLSAISILSAPSTNTSMTSVLTSSASLTASNCSLNSTLPGGTGFKAVQPHKPYVKLHGKVKRPLSYAQAHMQAALPSDTHHRLSSKLPSPDAVPLTPESLHVSDLSLGSLDALKRLEDSHADELDNASDPKFLRNEARFQGIRRTRSDFRWESAVPAVIM